MKPVLLQAIHIKLMPSNLLLGLIGGISIVCCWILITLPISLYLKLAIIALITASSTFFILRDALLILPGAWKVVEVDNKGELTVTNKSGQKFQLIPAPSSFIHAGCSVLNFKAYKFKYGGLNFALPPVILLPSAENADALRCLRVWLHWFRHEENQEDLAADLVE
jgi:hypothetical protein